MTARDAKGQDFGPRYYYVEVGATMNRNTGPPRTTLGKGGRPIIVTATVLPKYRRIRNPARESKYGADPRLQRPGDPRREKGDTK